MGNLYQFPVRMNIVLDMFELLMNNELEERQKIDEEQEECGIEKPNNLEIY